VTKDELRAAATEAYDVGYAAGVGEGWAEGRKFTTGYYAKGRRRWWHKK
jgi:hypothetical protein